MDDLSYETARLVLNRQVGNAQNGLLKQTLRADKLFGQFIKCILQLLYVGGGEFDEFEVILQFGLESVEGEVASLRSTWTVQLRTRQTFAGSPEIWPRRFGRSGKM